MAGFFARMLTRLAGNDRRSAQEGSGVSGLGNNKGGTMPASIEQGMEWQAADFIAAFSAPGSPIEAATLDYSEASLGPVDAMLDDFYQQKAPLPDDLHFLTSAYIFEVARRSFGGQYLRGDQENPFVLVIRAGAAEIGVCIMSKVRGRTINGPEDSIPFFYEGIAPLVEAGANATLI